MNFRRTAVAVGTSLASIRAIPVGGLERFGFSVKNNTANALNAFEIRARFHESGPWLTLVSAGGDFTTPNFPVIKGTNLVTLAGNTTGYALINVHGMKEIAIWASAGTATNVDIDGFGC